MKKNWVIAWFILSSSIFLGLLFFVMSQSYLYIPLEDGITLLDYDNRLTALAFLNVFFVIVVYAILFISKSRSVETLHKNIVRFLPILPLYSILQGLTWLLFDIFATKDQTYYFKIGTRFINANLDGYSNQLTLDQIANIGEQLKYGSSFYLLIVLLVLLLLNQTALFFIFPLIRNKK